MSKRQKLKTIMDREMMSASPVCPACGRNFSMGETVVPACGNWGDSPRWVHEQDAVFEESSGAFYERKCYEARKKS